MNRHQTIVLLVMFTTGCTAPRSFIPQRIEEETAQERIQLSRMQSVPQLQVDALSVYGRMIEYFVNPDEMILMEKTSETQQTVAHCFSAALSFKPGNTALLSAYSGNRIELERLNRELGLLMADAGEGIETICITGYASPDGTTERNEELAAGRALHFSNYLSRKLAIPRQKITVGTCQEDWEGLQRLTKDAHKPYAAEVAAILTQNTEPDARRKALKALDKGRVWKDMEQTLFARLRRMELEVSCLVREPIPEDENSGGKNAIDLNRLLALFNNRPEQLSLDELLMVGQVFRPGTEQFREVYEQAAYRFPDCVSAQLNAGAAALAAADIEAARFFLGRIENDPCAWIDLGILSLMEGDMGGAADWFRKALPVRPILARTNLELLKRMETSRLKGN